MVLARLQRKHFFLNQKHTMIATYKERKENNNDIMMTEKYRYFLSAESVFLIIILQHKSNTVTSMEVKIMLCLNNLNG